MTANPMLPIHPIITRLLALITAILLLACLPCAPSARAEAFTPGSDLAQSFSPPLRNIQSLAALGDHLVMADSRSLHTISPAGASSSLPMEAVLGPVQQPSYRQPLLIPGDKDLYLLDLQSGQLASLSLGNGGLAAGDLVQLDWEDYITRFEHYNQVEPPREFAVAGGSLYALEGQGTALLPFDLITGKKGEYAGTKAMKLISYKEGKLLLITLKDQGEGQPRVQMLSLFDPKADSANELGPITEEAGIHVPGAASYDLREDALLLALNDTVYRYDSLGPGLPCASLPLNEFYLEQMPLAALPGSRLAVASRDNVFVKSANPESYASQTQLNLLVSTDNPFGLNEAMNQADGILLKTDMRSLDALEFAQLLLTGESDYDLFWVKLHGVDLDSLIKKGYAADLSQSSTLQAAHRQLYPFLQEACGQEGRAYALPMTAHATVLLGEKRYAFDDKGQPLITSIQGFLDYLEAWQEGFGKDNPDMVSYRGYLMREGAFKLALNTYINQAMAQGEALDFDTPQLRAIFSRIDAMDWAGLGDRQDGEDYAAPALFDNEWLIYLRLMDGDGRDSHHYFPFLLAAEEGQRGALPLTVSCVFVNAKSKNIDKAIRFLEILSGNLQPDARILLREKDNNPVENPYYEQTLKDYRELLARKRQEMDQAPELEKAELASWLKRAEGYYEEMKESQRWQISPGQIAAFRQLAQNAFVLRYDSNAQGAQAAFDILPQYVDGSISLDQYITEIQNRLRLIQQENQ